MGKTMTTAERDMVVETIRSWKSVGQSDQAARQAAATELVTWGDNWTKEEALAARSGGEVAMAKRRKPCPNIDFKVSNNGSTISFLLFSEAAKDWVVENVQLEAWQWMGTSTFIIDHRYADQLIAGMEDAGFVRG